jgi:hypothetical protein
VCDTVDRWQLTFLEAIGRRMVYAADEYYLMAGRPFPARATYEGFPQHENGLGMARAFEAAFGGDEDAALGVRPGFFSWVDGAPATGYRALRADPSTPPGDGDAPVGILTGEYGSPVLAPLVASLGRPDIRIIAVKNDFFGGNIGVSGLMVGADLTRTLEDQPAGHRYLLPDSCLSEGRFLDDLQVTDLPRPVETAPPAGLALGGALVGRAPAGRGCGSGPTVTSGVARVPVSIGASR